MRHIGRARHVTIASVRPPAVLALIPRDVHLWWVNVDAPAEPLARLENVLAPDEHRRAARFAATRDRTRYVVARAVLRSLLARYLAVDPRDVPIGYGTDGKPEVGASLPLTGLEFNLAHSGHLALFAFARGRRVGIDVEAVRPVPDLDLVARHVCTPRERQYLDALAGIERGAAFLRGWTRKEALAKGVGAGLRMGLERLEVPLDANAAPTTVHLETNGAAETWWLHPIDVGRRYVAALAIESDARPILDGLRANAHTPSQRCRASAF